MRLLTVATISSALALFACSTTKETSAQKTPSSRDYISAEEIKTSAATDAYDLIKSLRPHWLQGRGAKSIKYAEAAYPVVYVNDSRHGTIESLHSISVHNITEIRFLGSGEASNRLGLNHPSGAILISMF